MPIQGRKLILDALGEFEPGESDKSYLRRGSQETGIGFASMLKGWKNQYMSKKTIAKLQERAADNGQKLASKLERLAADAERMGRNRSDVDAIRNLARRFERHDNRAGKLAGRE